ncbi:MAG: P-II family nitrogen regulator [Bacteroidota bacterium]|jgi:nitrogen regulatory protein P-II 1|nr:P-II family nitrogen regulator [Petrimonas sp.]
MLKCSFHIPKMDCPSEEAHIRMKLERLSHIKNLVFDIENITLSSAEGTGKLQDEKAFVSQIFSVTDSEIAKLENVAENKDVDTICTIICEYGCTLNPDDGLIYISDIEKGYRVKMGLENEEK